MSEIVTAKSLRNTLGSFWNEFHNDSDSFLPGVMQAVSIQGRQADNNIKELRDTTNIETVPVHHTELWRSITLIQDRSSGSPYKIVFDTAGSKFGGYGDADIYKSIPTFGGATTGFGLSTDDVVPEEVMFLSDSTDNPTFILVNGFDFSVRNGLFVLAFNPDEDPRFDGIKTADLGTNTYRYSLTGYGCKYDLHTAARQWGYLMSFEHASSGVYNKALWCLWKARRFGLTSDTFAELISIYMGCPRCKTDGEIVIDIIVNPDNTRDIITTDNVYNLQQNDLPLFPAGTQLQKGLFLGRKVRIIGGHSAAFIRNEVTSLPEYDSGIGKSIDGFIEANYIVFTANTAPSTIEKDNSLDYTPASVSIKTDSGSLDIKVKSLTRFSASSFTIEIEPHLFPGSQTQTASVQLRSISGIPLFSEPYTGGAEPVRGVINLITDRDDLLKLHPDALLNRISSVKRVAMIAMFDDEECRNIKSLIESFYSSNSEGFFVEIFKTVNLYDDLDGAGPVVSVSVEQLLNFDMVLVNTSSGVLSKLDTVSGSPLSGPSAVNTEFTKSILSNIDAQIGQLTESLSKEDAEVMWLLNYVESGSDHDSPEWLYKLCGIFNTPDYKSDAGRLFYTFGAFSSLQGDKVGEAETNNKKLTNVFNIPVTLPPSSTGSGVSSTQSSSPVFSRAVNVTSTVPRLVTDTSTGYRYSYNILNITKDS